MRSWVLLLLLAALSAARLRLSSAEGDPLPMSLVDLVMDSPISSVDDLKLLLQQETNLIEEEEDEHDIPSNHTHGRYIRSLVEAPMAQPAACKVRTEVMEVTRSMLDRRNANFMLWPPCLEVQRCSGCCNTRLLQCVPTVTSSRYIQVIKIQYVNKKPRYDKAIISVEDHVSCRCQAPSSPSSSLPVPMPRSSTVSNPNPPLQQQPPPSSHILRPVQPVPTKTQTSKADLHRHDDLKHNQQHHHPEERESVAKQWQHGSYTQLVHWTQPRVHQTPTHVQPRVQQPIAGGLTPVSSWPSEARAEHSIMGSTQPVGHGSGYDGSKEESGVHVANSGAGVHHSDHMQRQQQLLQHQQRQQQLQQQYQYHQQPHYPTQYNPGAAQDQEMRTQYRLNAPQSDSASPPASPTRLPTLELNPTLPLTTKQRDSVTSQKTTEVTNHRQTETATASQKEGSEREESGSANSGAGAELASQGKERDSKVTSGYGHLTEEERRRLTLETIQQELDRETHLHPHHPQQRPKPTTFKTALSTPSPVLTSARQAPFRPASPRRRRRKHRKRISKSAMRAMIM
ncbi:putative mediator of RNA polymerase II transcription subunit 26 [Notolabrus celidotus]|uniref:putative mediator of RNA polymerase II transcription subunit 26 n=1 Tax=Notolabrus celidotus TaxID=1203425 RepID=UPI0014905643|nr:putative mediator of RNA polymerase II transcription subunit 26 [Notolabrus celidotus]